MDSNNKYRPFDRQTLLKYLKGELSPAESWKVEKAMQEDPFLAEAMEGLESAGRDGDITKDLKWLKKRISKRKRHKIIGFELPNLLNIAAILLILVVSAWLVILYSRENAPSKTEIALKNQKVEKDSVKSGDYTDAGIRKSGENTQPVSRNGEKKEKEANQAGKKSGPGEVKQTAPVIIPEADVQPVEEEKKELSDIDTKPVETTGKEAAGTGQDRNKDISIIDDKQRQDDLEREISAGAAGKAISPTEMKVKDKNNNAKRAMDQTADVNIKNYAEPYPQPGDSLYKEYIIKNLHYPEQARATRIQGDVVLQFMVRKDSTLDHLLIISGPGGGCNEEALRLVREGPRWCPAISNGIPVSTRVYYTVQFRIKP